MTDEKPLPAGDLDIPLDASEDQLEKLIHDADETYWASASTGNFPSASAALNVKLRAINAKNARAEAKSGSRDDLLSADPNDCSTWSAELAHWVRLYTDGILSRVRLAKGES
jgi:hypothetical protein